MQRITPAFLFQSLALICCVALVIFLPSLHFMPKIIIWDHDAQRLLELILLGFVLLSVIFNGLPLASNSLKQNTFNPINRIACYAFSIVLILATSSALLAQSPRHAIIEICLFVALTYLAVLIARLYVESKALFIKRLIILIWVGILLYLLAFYVGYITAVISKTPLRWSLAFAGFSNIRTFNQVQLWSLGLLSLPLLTFDLKNSTRRWLYIALTFWWVLLFYSASRGALIAWLVGLIMTAVVYRKLAWPLLRSQTINMVTGLCGYLLLFKAMPMLRYPAIPMLKEPALSMLRESASGRTELWQQAIMLAKSAPWLGVGPMHYAWNSSESAHPHNSVLQFAAELGLPATLLILAIVGYGLYYWLKTFNLTQLEASNKRDRHLTIILFFTLMTNTAYSLVDGVIVMPLSQAMMFIVIGVCLGHYTYTNTPSPKNNVPATQRKFNLSAILAGVVLIAMTWATAPEVIQGLSGDKKSFSIDYRSPQPRLWREMNGTT